MALMVASGRTVLKYRYGYIICTRVFRCVSQSAVRSGFMTYDPGIPQQGRGINLTAVVMLSRCQHRPPPHHPCPALASKYLTAFLPLAGTSSTVRCIFFSTVVYCRNVLSSNGTTRSTVRPYIVWCTLRERKFRQSCLYILEVKRASKCLASSACAVCSFLDVGAQIVTPFKDCLQKTPPN